LGEGGATGTGEKDRPSPKKTKLLSKGIGRKNQSIKIKQTTGEREKEEIGKSGPT